MESSQVFFFVAQNEGHLRGLLFLWDKKNIGAKHIAHRIHETRTYIYLHLPYSPRIIGPAKKEEIGCV